MAIDGVADPAFEPLVDKFQALYRKPGHGGGALAVYVGGEPVVDVWAGYADGHGGRPWQADTMALSFSTTKGVASTVLHRLVEQGLLGYDTPIAEWWPEFGAQGKESIPLRWLLSHRAGLHSARGLVEDPALLLDHRHIGDLLARARPRLKPGGPPAYHGLTYGWLLAAIVERVTGRAFTEVLSDEVVRPLELDGCYVGVPEDQRHRVATLFPGVLPKGMPVDALARRFEHRRPFAHLVAALAVDGMDRLIMGPDIHDAVMPGVNGVFTARSLAKMYGALANKGVVGGVRLLEADTVHELGRVQTRERDRVLALPMLWRLGYHRALTAPTQATKAFGHFGYGGSGGWADPETGMSIAFVTNRLGNATTPVGDARLLRLGDAALRAVREDGQPRARRRIPRPSRRKPAAPGATNGSLSSPAA